MDNQTSIEQLTNMSNADPQIDSTVDDIINQINGGEELNDIPPPQQLQQHQQQQQQHQQQQLQQPEINNAPLQVPPSVPMPPLPIQQQQPLNMDTSDLNSNIESLGNTVVTHLKQPLIILGLYSLLNIKQVDNVFKLKNIKYLVNDDGQLTFISVLIKGIILALLFYLIKMFV